MSITRNELLHWKVLLAGMLDRVNTILGEYSLPEVEPQGSDLGDIAVTRYLECQFGRSAKPGPMMVSTLWLKEMLIDEFKREINPKRYAPTMRHMGFKRTTARNALKKVEAVWSRSG